MYFMSVVFSIISGGYVPIITASAARIAGSETVEADKGSAQL
jgi:hypothetical protein